MPNREQTFLWCLDKAFSKWTRKIGRKYGGDFVLIIHVMFALAISFTMIGFTLCLSLGESCMNEC